MRLLEREREDEADVMTDVTAWMYGECWIVIGLFGTGCAHARSRMDGWFNEVIAELLAGLRHTGGS